MKILVMEDSTIIPTIVRVLEHIDRTDKIDFEILFALSAVEARGRIADVDMAIISIEAEGRSIAEFALNEVGIPVIATSTLTRDVNSVRESKNLRFIQKPSSALAKFTQVVRELVTMVQNGQSEKQQLDTAAERVRKVLAPQIPARN